VYGLPISSGALSRLSHYQDSLRVILMLDNVAQVPLLERSAPIAHPWRAFIKIDVGTHRAGLEPDDEQLAEIIQRVESSPAVELHGFYCHAGHSYSVKTQQEAAEALQAEWKGVLDAARSLPADRPLVLSIGATPTAHIVSQLKASVPANVTLELHAGMHI
jgi:D-serine ammonia-lyase